jgi:hypothetical protein
MDNNLVTIFIAVAAVAIVVQMGILLALYIGSRKTSARVEALADELQQHGIPALKAARTLLEENGPKVSEIMDNGVSASRILKMQAVRLDATVGDIMDRTRLQVIRADELVSRTIDRVEDTTNLLHHSVISPVRQAAGILQGITAGTGWLLGKIRPRQRHDGAPEDEMFI